MRRRLIEDASLKYFVGQLTSAIVQPCQMVGRHDDDDLLVLVHDCLISSKSLVIYHEKGLKFFIESTNTFSLTTEGILEYLSVQGLDISFFGSEALFFHFS